MAEVFRMRVPTQTEMAMPTRVNPSDELTVDSLSANDGYMTSIRDYMSDRLGDSGQQAEEEDNQEYIERFLTHMRSFENRSLELGSQIDHLRKADEVQRRKFLNAYTIYNQLPGFMSEGGGSAASAIADYAYYNVVDPVNLVGLGVGSVAAKQLAKQGVKGLMLGIAQHGAVPFLTDGAIGAGMDLGLQRIEKEVGVRDEYDMGRAGTAFALSGAGSAAAQGIGLGLKKGFDSTFGRNLAEEQSTATEAIIDRNLAKRTSPEQVAADALDPDPARTARVKASPDSPDAPFDPDRGREILDRIGQAGDTVNPELRVDINRYIYDFLDDMLTDAPNKELALQIRTPSGQRVADEQISDTVFRVLQNKAVVEGLDEDALSGALARQGISPEEFAQIYRMTVREAAQTMNAAGQFAKKLSSAGVLDRKRTDALTAYLTEGEPTTMLQRGVRAAARPGRFIMDLDRNRRGLLVSQIPTLIRNVGTTGIRGAIDTGADIIDAAAFYGLRKVQKNVLGMDKPDYSLGHALSDAFGMSRNLIDQGFSRDVVEATLGNNPKLLHQISRSMTDIGDGSLAAPVRALNFLNMTHDGLVRRAIYTASLEKQLQRQTGLSVAETLVKNGRVPLEMQQKAVREALEFTFANMPTGRFQNAFVKAVEAAPFIGTGILTFPRFTVAALNFTGNYVLGGKLAKGVAKVARGAAGNERLLDEGMTDLSKGIVGTYFLFESIAHRAANQDVKWFEYKDEEGRVGDMRPFFPLAPYMLVADAIVKYGTGDLFDEVPLESSPYRAIRRGLGDEDFREDVGEIGTGKSLPARDIVEGILGTRLAGAQLYLIDGFFKGLSTESDFGDDQISAQKFNEALGNFLGELTGGPVNVNLITGLVRDITRTFITEEAVMRDSRAQTAPTSEGRFDDAFGAAFTRGMPFMNRDRPELESATREETMYYQSPLATTFTGIRKSAARTALEDEITRLGITYNQINPSTGDTEANRMLTRELGIIAPDIIDLESSTYRNMPDSEKKNYIIGMYQTARGISRDIAKGKSYSESATTIVDQDDVERTYTPFDRAQWGAVPERIRKVVNEYYIQNFGGTVEELGAYRAGNVYANVERSKFN